MKTAPAIDLFPRHPVKEAAPARGQAEAILRCRCGCAAQFSNPSARKPFPNATLASLGRMSCTGVLQFPVLVQRHQALFSLLGGVVRFRGVLICQSEQNGIAPAGAALCSWGARLRFDLKSSLKVPPDRCQRRARPRRSADQAFRRLCTMPANRSRGGPAADGFTTE